MEDFFSHRNLKFMAKKIKFECVKGFSIAYQNSYRILCENIVFGWCTTSLKKYCRRHKNLCYLIFYYLPCVLFLRFIMKVPYS